MLLIVLFLLFAIPVHAEETVKEPVIVCIDPGHGGNENGGEWGEYLEKDLNLSVALAMKERLEQYDNVEVWLTRSDDQKISLQKRVDYSAEKGADFLVCLHFNMSENHSLYGSEVWIPAFGENYVQSNAFAQIEEEALKDYGMLSRGVKTKINKENLDYYGILRHCTEYNIPGAIIEHCHLDHEMDSGFYTSVNSLKELGWLDADSVAKYFHLKSEQLSVDYADYPLQIVPVPGDFAHPDTTAPDVCQVTLLDQQGDTAQIEISAADYDGKLLYYAISFDNGETYQSYLAWPEGKDTFRCEVYLPSGVLPILRVKVSNQYDKVTESQGIPMSSVVTESEETLSAEESDELSSNDLEDAVFFTHDFSPQRGNRQGREGNFVYFLQVCFVAVFALFLLFFISLLLLSIFNPTKGKRKKKKNGKK